MGVAVADGGSERPWNEAASKISRLEPHQYLLPLLGLALLWPALINRAPFLFPDTTAYVRSVDAVALRYFGVRTDWTNADVVDAVGASSHTARSGHGAAAASARDYSHPDAARAEPEHHAKPVLLGRSIFYGFLAYLGAITGTFWTTIVLQALIAGAVLVGTVRYVISPRRRRTFAVACVVMTLVVAATPLAYFACMVMPDVFTGLLVVAAAALLTGWRRERTSGRAFWIAVASAGALVHSSHVLMLLTLAVPVLVLAAVWRSGPLAAGATALLLPALLGLAGEMAFSRAVASATGNEPIRPPFLTARLVEDGAGMRVLARHCTPTQFQLCLMRARLPVASDTFLWSEDANGVFRRSSPAQQRALAGEQGRFVRAAIVEQPGQVLASSLDATWRQLRQWRLPEFATAPLSASDLATNFPDRVARTVVITRSFDGDMPVAFTEALTAISIPLMLALLICAWLLPGGWRGRHFALALVTGWVVNVAVCGTLSTPHDRYQARVIWVLTLGILFVAGARYADRRFANDHGSPSPLP